MATMVATPVLSVIGGFYSAAQTVSITCATVGATIVYTTDGSLPTHASTVYSTPITTGTHTTIIAMAFKAGDTDSFQFSAGYVIGVIPMFVQLALDTFQRADENPLDPARWSSFDPSLGSLDLQIVSHQCQGNGTPNVDESAELYTGISWPADQWAEITIGNSAECQLMLRTDPLFTTGYVCLLEGPPFPAAPTHEIHIEDVIGGSFIYDSDNTIRNVGDIFRIAAQGTHIYLWQNGVLIAAVESATTASGSSGLLLANYSANTDSYITNYQGGSISSSSGSADGGVGSLGLGLSLGSMSKWEMF